MSIFVGRTRELKRLEGYYKADGPKAVAIYGRRRIGKSELIHHFCENKRTIPFEFAQRSEKSNLALMALSMLQFNGKERSYQTIIEALADIAEECKKDRTVVVFDEYPYLASCGEHIPSCIQVFIDEMIRDTDTMVIVCGSSISMMKEETEEYDRPLYGRFFYRMELGPLSYGECRSFHPDIPEIEYMKLFMTTGGIPRYHQDTDVGSYREFVVKHLLSDDADLSDEADIIIGSEFSPLGRYASIVEAVAVGRTSLKEICEYSGVEKGTGSRYVSKLESVGILGKVHPMFGAPKKPVYRVDDPMTEFCLTVVKDSRGWMMGPEAAFDALEGRINVFLGRRFERLCAEYVKKTRDCVEIGTWWGRDSDGITQEIDIAAIVMENRAKTGLFCECKFTKRRIPASVLKELEARIDIVRPQTTARLALFSAGGFTNDIIESAENLEVELVDLEKLTEVLRWPSPTGMPRFPEWDVDAGKATFNN